MELIDQLKSDEGFNSHPYTDSVGKLTIGYGFNIAPDGPGLVEDESEAVLAIRAAKVVAKLQSALPWFDSLNDARQAVLANMAYNMGTNGLFAFHRALAMCEAGNYEGCADAMKESKWYSQVGKRAVRLCEQMKSGNWIS